MQSSKRPASIPFSALAIVLAVGFFIFSHVIIFLFFIYGYRITPLAWTVAFSLSALTAFIPTIALSGNLLTIINKNRKMLWELCIICISIALGGFIGWHLGVPNAQDFPDYLYEGLLEPLLASRAAVWGAFFGYMLGNATVSIAETLLFANFNRVFSYSIGLLSTTSVLIGNVANLLGSNLAASPEICLVTLSVGILLPIALPFLYKTWLLLSGYMSTSRHDC